MSVKVIPNIEQLLQGINVEMEHTNNRDIAKKIAMDHLSEDPKYYDKLAMVMPNEVTDPRGDGPVKDPGNMRNGQPNIIDYSNKEPLLFGAGENSSHEYPGKIVINNESNYVDREVKKNTIPGPAATGESQPLNDITQPTLPTGGPQVIPPGLESNKHGNNFNHNLNQNLNDNITITPPEAQRKTNEEEITLQPYHEAEFHDDNSIKRNLEPLDSEYSYQEMREALARAERVDLKQDLPAAQTFSDTGRNENVESLPTTDDSFEGLHGTGTDLSRTGPGGNNPKDNYDSEHYEGQGDVKINLPTPYYSPDAKKIYDISGVVPEYQEDIRIIISDPEGDEKFMPEIKIDIAGHFEPKEDESKNLEKNDLKNNPGRKDPGTHINTIKAGENGIADLMPISDLWKEKNDALGPYSEFEFHEAIFEDGKNVTKETRWIFVDNDLIPVKPGETKSDAVAKFRKKDSPKTTDQDRFFDHPSSWIGTVRYFPQSQKMGVKMNGKTYTHCGVTEREFDSFQGAPSKGEHWNRFFKNNNQCVQGLSEALNIYKHKQPDEFNWINPEEIENMKNYSKERGKGRFILAVASGESVTDHRPEGRENLRRRWTANEMSQNIRTSKGKLIDINHMHSKIDPHSGGIYDANWNEKTQKGEMMIWETDEVILDAIRDGIIEAVSINTGKPRRIDTNCENGECFIEPSGTILGEENGVALAYVVTHPDGLNYHGQHIPALPPGMKFTKIYLVE